MVFCLAALVFPVPAGAQEPATQPQKTDTQEQAGTPKTASESQDPKPDAVTYQVEVVGAVPRTAAPAGMAGTLVLAGLRASPGTVQ